MADLSTKNIEGDALSRLIQQQAARYDIRLTWTGKGVDDLTALLNAHAVKARMAKHLWNATKELMQMPEIRDLPEPVQAQIAATILKGHALTELDNDEHARRLALVNKTKG
jgi:hypothetical protein